jgi:hypothetical protein
MGVNLAQTKYISLINSDIVLSALWYPAVVGMLDLIRASFQPIMLSSRWDVDFPESSFAEIRFSEARLLHDIDNVMKNLKMKRYTSKGIDIFTFRRKHPPFDPAKIPPFLMGKPCWDYWLMAWTSTFCNTIFTNYKPYTYHLNHGKGWRALSREDLSYNEQLSIADGWLKVVEARVRWILEDGKLLPGDYIWTGSLRGPEEYDRRIFAALPDSH